MEHHPSDEGERRLGRIAARNAREQARKAKMENWSPARKIWDFFAPLVIGVFAVLLIRYFVVTPMRVDGDSMRETLHHNERMVVLRYERFFKLPDYGDVIICTFSLLPENQRDVVKRVVGLPGDTIELVDGYLYRNGEAIDEPYLLYRGSMNYGPVTVREDSVFVLGDNRPNSHDSRMEGSIPGSKILGTVWSVFYPFSEARLVK